ncbi:MAG: Ig-like domain-containing protein, partial [Propionibacteriaceae bacterium]|nr:Ig-like domain-containing protein [Propionibacteriaceae bacterium]
DYNSAVIDQASLLTLTGEASADFSNVLSLRTQLIPPRMMGVAAVTNTMNVRLDTGDDLTLSDVFTNGANIGGMIQLEAQASDPNCDEICANAKAAQFRANPNPSFNLTTSGVTVLGVTIPFASYWPQVAIFKRFAGVTGLSTVPSPARCQVISTQWDITRQACMPLKYQVADFGTVIVPAAGGSASTKLPVGLGQRWFVLHDSACSDETQATGVTPESGAGPTDLTVTAPSNTLPSNITTWACIMVIDPTTHLASFGQVQVIQDAMEPNWQVTVNPADGTTITTSAPQFSGVVTSTTDNTPVTSAFVAVNLAGTTTAICSDTTNSQGQWSCTAQIPLSNGPQPLSVQAQALAGWGRTDLTLNVDAPNAPGAPVITTPSAGQLIHATLPSGSGWLPQNVFIAGTADPSSHILITGGYVTDAGLTDVATTVVANQAGAWQTALTIYLLPGGSAQVRLAARSTFGQGVSPSTVTLAFMVTADGGYTIEIPATGYETDKVTVTRVDMQGKHKTATFTATATTVDPAVQVLTSNVTADNGTAELSFAATANGYHDVQIWVDGQPVPLAADGAPKPTSLSFVATPMPQTPPAAPIVNIANGFQIAGRAQAGSVVSLTYTVVDGTKTTTTPSDSDGQWELSTPPDAVDGPMTVTADNTIGTSNPATLRLDVIAPQPPMVADADKTHITGTTEAGAWVVVTYANGKPLGSTAADFTGNWVMKTPRWAPSGTIIVKATDRAGNQSEPTTATLTIAMSIGDDATPDPTTSSSEPTTILPSLTPIETEPAPGQTTITGTVLSGSEVKTTSTVDATADAAHTGGQVTNNGEPVLMIIAITLMIGAAVAARIRRRNQFL